MSTNHTIRQMIIDEDLPKLVKLLTGFNVRLFIKSFYFIFFSLFSMRINQKSVFLKEFHSIFNGLDNFT